MEQAQVITAESHYTYASFWRRLAAYVIDGTIISIPIWPIASIYAKQSGLWDMIMAFVTASRSGLPVSMSDMGVMVLFETFFKTIIIVSAISYGIHILYFSIWESSKFQATPGKMASRLKVVNQNGQRMGFLQALARNFLKLLSSVILYIGYLMVFVTEKRQSLHDKISNSYVLKTSYEVPHIQGVEYAGFWRRFVAWFLDVILIWILIYPLRIFMLTGSHTLGEIWMNNLQHPDHLMMPSIDEIIRESCIGLFTTLLTIFYFASFESSRFQATPGKIVIGIRVTDQLGQRISFWRAVGRYLAKTISGMTLLIGYIMAGVTPKQQALHDELADTLVIKSQVPRA